MSQLYLPIKWTHVACVILSGGLFTVRGAFVIMGSASANQVLLRRLSYGVDTTLLVAALMLASIIRQWPFVQDWLTMKVLLLFAYITLGIFALRLGRTRTVRLACFVSALVVYGDIVSVAVTHDPRGFLILVR